jgi:hypothetical protein
MVAAGAVGKFEGGGGTKRKERPDEAALFLDHLVDAY